MPPQRSLRSEVLKNALKSFIIPPLLSKYQTIAVRALIDSDTAKKYIWGKRRELEKILQQNKHVVAFFSCVTALQQKKKEKKRRYSQDESTSDEEENEESKENIPGVAFWIAFDWPEHGLQAFENEICREFLSTNLDVISCKVVKGRGKNYFLKFISDVVYSFIIYVFQIIIGRNNTSSAKASAQSLFAVLKDHNCESSINLIEQSHKFMVREAAAQQGWNMDTVAVTDGEDFSCKPVQIVLLETLDGNTRKDILNGLRQVTFANLKTKVINFVEIGKFIFRTNYSNQFPGPLSKRII